jgi:homoserine O-acetyltransferase
MTAMCSYRSPGSFERKFRRERSTAGEFQVESYLRYQGEKLVRRFDANSYLVLSRAMDSHDVARGRGPLSDVLGAIQPRVLVLGISSDILYPPHELKELASGIPGSCLTWIESEDGHDAFLIEQDQVNQAILALRRDCAEISHPVPSWGSSSSGRLTSPHALRRHGKKRTDQCA